MKQEVNSTHTCQDYTNHGKESSPQVTEEIKYAESDSSLCLCTTVNKHNY